MPQPNIVFIFSDQQRADTLGCYGQPLNVTPTLDRLAQEGVRFQHAFTCQPVCGPARACLQTGKYATELGCFKNGIGLPQDEKTIAHWFAEAGYATAYIGKWHLASTKGKAEYGTVAIPPEFRGGWNEYWLASDVLEFTSHGYDGHMFDKDMNKVEFTGYRADCMTDFALDYLKNRDTTRPFVLFLSYIEPHHQNDRKHYEGPDGSKERFKDFVAPGDLQDTEGDWREEYPDYLGCCASLDENTGRILEELERQGILDETVIFYTSDHGSHFRTRNREYKRSCHDGTIHVPLVARGPGFSGGNVINDLVSLIDLPPTLLASAGVTPPDSMQGRPLQSLVNGTAQEWPEEVFVQISESQVGRAIRTRKWKYSVWAPEKHRHHDSGSDTYLEDFLYDLEADPYEKQNLIADPQYADVRRELAERLKRCMAQAGEPVPDILPQTETPPFTSWPLRK